jgi:hypothetical protein
MFIFEGVSECRWILFQGVFECILAGFLVGESFGRLRVFLSGVWEALVEGTVEGSALREGSWEDVHIISLIRIYLSLHFIIIIIIMGK